MTLDFNIYFRMKLKYLVDQGLYSYFSHKVDECGVHFFDPLYYEETEPFHANLRLVTNIYNNQRIKLIPSYFKKFRKQFQYKVLWFRFARISLFFNGLLEDKFQVPHSTRI